jgi:hypothetical protein
LIGRLLDQLVVHVVAWGLRSGLCDDEMERRMRSRFPTRDGAWRWEIIGDAHLLNDRKQVKRDYRAWKAAR